MIGSAVIHMQNALSSRPAWMKRTTRLNNCSLVLKKTQTGSPHGAVGSPGMPNRLAAETSRSPLCIQNRAYPMEATTDAQEERSKAASMFGLRDLSVLRGSAEGQSDVRLCYEIRSWSRFSMSCSICLCSVTSWITTATPTTVPSRLRSTEAELRTDFVVPSKHCICVSS